MFVRVLPTAQSGRDGVRTASEDRRGSPPLHPASLKDIMSEPFEGSLLHGAFRRQASSGHWRDHSSIFANAMIERAITDDDVFSLFVHGAMLIEPPSRIEGESRPLSYPRAALRGGGRGEGGPAERFEVRARTLRRATGLDRRLPCARKPVLRWRP